MLAIFKWNNPFIKDVLYYYCIEIEELYESILSKYNKFIEVSKSNTEVAKIYTKFV
jgi:hypothetical protein